MSGCAVGNALVRRPIVFADMTDKRTLSGITLAHLTDISSHPEQDGQAHLPAVVVSAGGG